MFSESSPPKPYFFHRRHHCSHNQKYFKISSLLSSPYTPRQKKRGHHNDVYLRDNDNDNDDEDDEEIKMERVYLINWFGSIETNPFSL